MKNSLVILFLMFNFISFSQKSYTIKLNTIIYDYSKNPYHLYPPIDSTEIFDGSFSTHNLFITDPSSDYINSTDYVDSTINNFVLDNTSNPTELTFKSTNTKFKLIPARIDTHIIDKKRYNLGQFITLDYDSAKYYLTDSDFFVIIYYVNKFVETIDIGLNSVTENTVNTANAWYNSINTNTKLDKNEILSMWINKTFLNGFSFYLLNKKYSDELINGKFVFVYTKSLLGPLFGNEKSW